MHDQAQEQKIIFFLTTFIDNNHFKKEKYGATKPFELNNFSEIFYYGMTRLKNTNLGVFIQYQYTRTILRKKNMGQSLFRNIQNF